MKIKHELEISFKEYQRSYVKKNNLQKQILQQLWSNNKICVEELLNPLGRHAGCLCVRVCVCVCVCVCDRRGSLILQNHLSY